MHGIAHVPSPHAPLDAVEFGLLTLAPDQMLTAHLRGRTSLRALSAADPGV
ncbi:hypothetical protein ACGFYU_11835 [Streptomyces sp. NPDC048337]|uniref:hypothetical protein n=1 Tax=Streptomyces sp. NPDC048337 TaxID=3365535 RepID=UPI0037181E7E